MRSPRTRRRASAPSWRSVRRTGAEPEAVRLRLLALALLAGAALAAQTTPAHAAATGPLAVHVEGSLGAPTLEQPSLTLWPFRAVVTPRGVVDGSSDTDGTLVAFETGDPDRPLQ